MVELPELPGLTSKPALDNLDLVAPPVAEALAAWRGAVGVAVVPLDDPEGAPEEIRADEVILCAGSVGSTQLLQLSGLGPGEWLSQAGVSVKFDRSGVGRNLQDHVAVSTVVKSPSMASYGISMRALPRASAERLPSRGPIRDKGTCPAPRACRSCRSRRTAC